MLDGEEEEAVKIWKMLDELARNDPEGYKSYIQKSEREARRAFWKVRPSYYVRCLDSNSSIHYLNICKSVAVPKGSDRDDVPTLISHKREFQEDGKIPLLISRWCCLFCL